MRRHVPWYIYPAALLAFAGAYCAAQAGLASVIYNMDKSEQAHEDISSLMGQWEDVYTAPVTFKRPSWWSFARSTDIQDGLRQKLVFRPRKDPLKADTWKSSLLDFQFAKDPAYTSGPTAAAVRASFDTPDKIAKLNIGNALVFSSVRNYADAETSLLGLKAVRSTFVADVDGVPYAFIRLVAQGSGNAFAVTILTPSENIQSAQGIFDDFLKTVAYTKPKSSSAASSSSAKAATVFSKAAPSSNPQAQKSASSKKTLSPFEIFLRLQKQKSGG